MNVRDIAEFMAARFMPVNIRPDDVHSYKQIGDRLYTVDKTWGEFLVEQYMEDAQAFLYMLESKRLQITEMPLL